MVSMDSMNTMDYASNFNELGSNLVRVDLVGTNGSALNISSVPRKHAFVVYIPTD